MKDRGISSSVQELQVSFKALIDSSFEKIRNLPLMEESYSDSVQSLRALSETVLRLQQESVSDGIQSSMENIKGNLLLQLQFEISSQQSLSKADAFGHLSSVYLLSQMTAEACLLTLLDQKGIEYQLRAINHSLWEMVKLLGVSLDQFNEAERDFLAGSRTIRFLARYPWMIEALPGGCCQPERKERLHLAINSAPIDEVKQWAQEEAAIFSSILDKVL